VKKSNSWLYKHKYISEGDSINKEAEYWEDCVEPTEVGSESAKDVTSDDCYCTGVDHTDSCFFEKGKTKRGKVKSSTHFRRRWQNILTNLPRVIGQARKAATPAETWNCLITGEILDSIVQHTNQYIFIIQTNFSCERNATLTGKIEIKLSSVFCA